MTLKAHARSGRASGRRPASRQAVRLAAHAIEGGRRARGGGECGAEIRIRNQNKRQRALGSRRVGPARRARRRAGGRANTSAAAPRSVELLRPVLVPVMACASARGGGDEDDHAAGDGGRLRAAREEVPLLMHADTSLERARRGVRQHAPPPTGRASAPARARSKRARAHAPVGRRGSSGPPPSLGGSAFTLAPSLAHRFARAARCAAPPSSPLRLARHLALHLALDLRLELELKLARGEDGGRVEQHHSPRHERQSEGARDAQLEGRRREQTWREHATIDDPQARETRAARRCAAPRGSEAASRRAPRRRATRRVGCRAPPRRLPPPTSTRCRETHGPRPALLASARRRMPQRAVARVVLLREDDGARRVPSSRYAVTSLCHTAPA